MRVLDLCCKQGGASRGYVDAGCDVVGVDVDPQPRYPYEFIQADALEVLRDRSFVAGFDFIHASWPCQKYSMLNNKPSIRDAAERLDLVAPGRALMITTGLPWVIENVVGAPLDPERSIRLCGGMFGLRTYRHRKFEPSPGLSLVAPAHPRHETPQAKRNRRERWAQGWHMNVTGGARGIGTYFGPEAMGIDWMDGAGLCQAIPPAYSRWVAGQVMAALGAQPVAA